MSPGAHVSFHTYCCSQCPESDVGRNIHPFLFAGPDLSGPVKVVLLHVFASPVVARREQSAKTRERGVSGQLVRLVQTLPVGPSSE